MVSLQKFKLLATQCVVAPSPTRSPRTSPVVHLRRRKITLFMLLSRSTSRRSSTSSQFDPPAQIKTPIEDFAQKKKTEMEKGLVQRQCLKELFGSSTSNEEEEDEDGCSEEMEKTSDNGSVGIVRFGGWKDGSGSPKPVWMGFRYRPLLRRAWRPMLVAIPE